MKIKDLFRNLVNSLKKKSVSENKVEEPMEEPKEFTNFIRYLKEKNLYRKDYYKEFVRFLRKYDICESFFTNFNSSNGVNYRLVRTNKTSLVDFIEYCRNCNEFDAYRKDYKLPQIVICYAFVWRETEEGHDFWSKIYHIK